MKHEKFFFFGCWNYDNCGKIDNRNSVINMIASDRDIYDFGIVAGDNIYSRKIVDESGKETKHMYDQTFDKISSSLHRLVKRKSKVSPFLNVILGNHDEEDKCILEKEIKQISMVPNTRLFLKNNRHSVVERDLAYYIYLNTNEQHIPKLKLFLKSLLYSDLDHRKWLIFVGHEPIYSLKYKKKEGKIKKLSELDSELILLFNTLQQRRGFNKMVYLCADTHNFQLLDVRSKDKDSYFNLPIVVSGTGGAKLDNIFPPHLNNRRNSNGEYNTNKINSLNKSFSAKGKPYRIRLKYGLKKHGYSSITVTPNKIFVNFISCNNKYKFKIGFDGVQTTIQKFKRTNKKLVGCYKQSTNCENKNIGCIKSEEKKSKKKK